MSKPMEQQIRKAQAILALAERAEAATGPDRNLDADIMRAIGLAGLKADYAPHPYSASLDAAMTLVPEGWAVLMAFSEQRAVCDVHTAPLGQHGTWPAHASAATPALALCAAALRARAETQP